MEQSIREGNSGSWKVDSVRAAAKMHENAARGHEASASKGGSKSSKGEKLKQFAEQKGKTGEAAKKPKGKKAEQMQRAMQTGKKGGRFYVSKGGRKVYIGRRG